MKKQTRMETEKNNVTYRPVLFLTGTFLITWCCAVFMERTDYAAHILRYTFLDFMENASPLFCALLLLAQHFNRDKFLPKFFLGKKAHIHSYIIVLGLFAVQFFNFYLFKVEDCKLSVQTFALTFAGQLLLGGGLEEAGWRGYLLPCLCKKLPVLLSSILVSIIWVLWHLPYFLIPGSMQMNADFISYSVIGIITGFILTAIYLLTGNVLLCMLFHSWQNTIVMTVQADMGDIRFMLIFVLLGVVSALLSLNYQKRQRQAK